MVLVNEAAAAGGAKGRYRGAQTKRAFCNYNFPIAVDDPYWLILRLFLLFY